MVHSCRTDPRPLGVSVESLYETPKRVEKRKGVKMVERERHWRHNISIWNILMSSDMGEMVKSSVQDWKINQNRTIAENCMSMLFGFFVLSSLWLNSRKNQKIKSLLQN